MKAKRVGMTEPDTSGHDRKVMYFMGLPSTNHWHETRMAMSVARWAPTKYTLLESPPLKVNRLRRYMIEYFLEHTSHPLDTLVCLDIDHKHPRNIVEALVGDGSFGVHMSLTFKRAPTLPAALAMDYKDGWDKPAHHIAQYTPGEILECDRGGTGAVAIQRRVFQAIIELGYGPAEMFLYKGLDDCDKWFAQLCSKAGYKHHVNTAIVSPHFSDDPAYIGAEEWDAWSKSLGHGGIVNDK